MKNVEEENSVFTNKEEGHKINIIKEKEISYNKMSEEKEELSMINKQEILNIKEKENNDNENNNVSERSQKNEEIQDIINKQAKKET